MLRSLFFFIPKVRERYRFERKNKSEVGSRSFSHENLKADLCFEFSSEGEYQQVASLIEDALSQGKRIELVFFSPSVEKTMTELFKRFPLQVRYLRYPILGLSFSRWITSSNLVLVRYDLFPEFLIWSLRPGRTLKFVWVTFKKERMKKSAISLFKRAFLWRSDFTVFASVQDEEIGKKMGLNGAIYDFRIEQIHRRLKNRLEKFSLLFPLYHDFKTHLNSIPRHQRLIFGNAWPTDLFLLKNIGLECFLVIVPHKLNPSIIEEMTEALVKMGRRPVLITDQTRTLEPSQIYILVKKGILCELYSDFGKAYVGGGFGVSVHSLLEPLVAGCEHLSCGPANHRSTEFDLALVYGQLKEVKTDQEFLSWMNEDVSSTEVHDKLKSQVEAYAQFRKEILSC
jgi:3-deoxy-D-manno-octulosonic-acid transferase